MLHWFVYSGWGIISILTPAPCVMTVQMIRVLPIPVSVCSLSDMKARRELISPITEDRGLEKNKMGFKVA